MSLTYGFALRAADASSGFSDALHAVTGDGVTLQGGRFNLSVNGFTATLASGYALAAGRWLENDEPLAMTIGASGNNEDRTDALTVRVDYEAREAALEVLVDIDPEAIQKDLSLVRSGGTYTLLLYFIRVRRGVTALTPDDVTDLRANSSLCGRVVPLSAIARDVLYIYQFLTSGIDAEVARITGLSSQVIAKADAAIAELDQAIRQAGGTPGTGELMTARHPPAPEKEWLLCDGGAVPAAYPALSAVLNGTLPNIPEERYKTYIYGGAPVGG